MNEEKKYYMVHRLYSSKERPGVKEVSTIYGWTSSKTVLKGFFKQRNEKKYLVVKMRMSEIEELISSNSYEGTGRYMIDFLKLKSAKTGEEFHLFMTVNELNEVERKVQKMFEELCSLDRIDKDNIITYVNLVLNLNEKYYDALFYLGYRPGEISGLCDSDIGYDIATSIYEGMPCEEYYNRSSCNDEGRISELDDASNKILYSIESFIKVMRNDL